jgi:hypothetical protein
METLCFVLLVILALIVIWKAHEQPGGSNVRVPSGRRAPVGGYVPIEVASNVIKPPISGAALGPMKEVAQSHMGKDPNDDPMSGRFAYVGLGGMSCPNKRWYDSVYNGGTYTEIDEPGVAWRDMNYESADMMPNGPRDPDEVRAYPEPLVQKNLLKCGPPPMY